MLQTFIKLSHQDTKELQTTIEIKQSESLRFFFCNLVKKEISLLTVLPKKLTDGKHIFQYNL